MTPDISDLIERLQCWNHGHTTMIVSEAITALTRLSERTSDAEWYLVWSNEHRCWWNPNSAGYTRQVQKAGRYSKAEAIEICRGRGWPKTGIPDEVPVRERDALECFAAVVSGSGQP